MLGTHLLEHTRIGWTHCEFGDVGCAWKNTCDVIFGMDGEEFAAHRRYIPDTLGKHSSNLLVDFLPTGTNTEGKDNNRIWYMSPKISDDTTRPRNGDKWVDVIFYALNLQLITLETLTNAGASTNPCDKNSLTLPYDAACNNLLIVISTLLSHVVEANLR